MTQQKFASVRRVGWTSLPGRNRADDPTQVKRLRAAWLVLFAVASGCSTQLATTRPPEPELNLVSSGEFALSDECKPEPGRVYRAEFTVRPDGAVSDIHATGDAACARDALARWISSFRYEARQAPASTVVDWMLVEARRGG